MAARKPLVLVPGGVQEIGSADTLIAAATPAFGDSSTSVATTAFVANAIYGVLTLPTSGGQTTLTQVQASMPVLVVMGTLTSNAVIIVPVSGVFTIINRTTGAFTLTVQTAAGTGVTVGQGYSRNVVADGTNVVAEMTDLSGSLSGAAFGGTISSPSGSFTQLVALNSFVVGSNALAQSSNLTIGAAVNQVKQFTLQSGGSTRWTIGSNSTPESGSNAGGDFVVANWSDTGAYLSSPITITRSSGLVTIGNIVVTATGRFTTLTSTGHALRSTAIGLTAAGTTQATALALTTTISVVATAAASTGVVLPNGGSGAEYIIINRGANTLNIYPPGSSVIDALAASAATTVATLATKRFVQVSATQYYTA